MPGLLLGLLIVGTIGLPLLASAAALCFVDTFTSLDIGDRSTLTGLTRPDIGGDEGYISDCGLRPAHPQSAIT